MAHTKTKMVLFSSSASANARRDVLSSNLPTGSPCRIWFLLFGVLSYQLGFLMGSNNQQSSSSCRCPTPTSEHRSNTDSEVKRVRQLLEPNKTIAPCPETTSLPRQGLTHDVVESKNPKRDASPPPIFVSPLFAGATHVHRDDFVATVDIGVPIHPSSADEVLILYSSKSSLPLANNAALHDNTLNVTTALEKCKSMIVVLTDHQPDSSCIAIMEQYESRHVHRFQQQVPIVDEENPRNESKRESPLRMTRRNFLGESLMPSLDVTNDYWKELVWYLSNQKATLTRLKPLAKAAAGDGKAVIVMVTNAGQSELFVNFVCAAKSRGLDTSNVLLFATDRDSVDLATTLGVKVFDVRGALGALPTEVAGSYGDRTFGRMAMAKIYCTHLMIMLGYDVLLQDVDVVWRRHPLEFFYSSSLDNYDLMFQDDGGGVRFAPYFGNTGFYFVRNNPRTVYFFNSLIRMGDLVFKLRCDQETIGIVMTEHVSLHGLRVKTFGKFTKDGMLFPCGYHYHLKDDFMKDMIEGHVHPYIFHMSWTINKDEKLMHFKQLGEWFVRPDCLNETMSILQSLNETVDGAAICCSQEPMIQCFHHDLPSKINCRNVTDKKFYADRGSFW